MKVLYEEALRAELVLAVVDRNLQNGLRTDFSRKYPAANLPRFVEHIGLEKISLLRISVSFHLRSIPLTGAPSKQKLWEQIFL